MRSGRSDLSWFLRAARVVPVIAGAALLGGMIGGFAIFAIDSALTWDPNPQSHSDARAENQASAVNPQTASQTPQTQTTKPARIVGGAIPDPSAGMSGPPPAQAPVQQPNAVALQLGAPEPLGLGLGSPRERRARLLDQRADDVGLTAGVQVLA